MLTLERADRPHAERLTATQPRKRIVTEERNAGPGRVVRVNVVAECDELEHIRPQLTAQQYDAALRLRDLWDRAALLDRRVIASYEWTVPRGSEEISDGKSEAWERFAGLARSLDLGLSADVIALVCFDEPRDSHRVALGLQRAAEWWGLA